MSPGKADRIIEANMATGVKYNSLVQNSSDISTVIAITMFDTAVSQPALKFTAVLENDPACTMQLLGTQARLYLSQIHMNLFGYNESTPNFYPMYPNKRS